MAGLFDEAQKSTDDASRAALAALAKGGSGALADYKASQQQLAAMKQAAATGALERAAAIGAQDVGRDLVANGSMSGLAEGGLVRSAGATYDRYAQDSERANTARQQALADMSTSNANYFGQVNAARPIVEGQALRQKAALEAKAAQEQQDREMRLMLQQMQLERANLDYATATERASTSREDRAAKAARSAQPKELTDTQLAARLIGAAKVEQTNLAARKAALPKGTAFTRLGSAGMAKRLDAGPAGQLSEADLARQLGVRAGVDPARAFGVVKDPKLAAPAKPLSPSQQLSNKTAQAQLDRLRVIELAKTNASPGTYFEVVKAINAGEAEQDAQAAFAYIDGLDSGYLKRNGIAREALVDWVKRYGAI